MLSGRLSRLRRFVAGPTGVVVLALGASALGVMMGSPTVAVAGPMLVLIGHGEQRRRSGRAREERASVEVLLLVDRMVQQLRAGSSLARALQDGLDWGHGSPARIDSARSPVSIGPGGSDRDAQSELSAVSVALGRGATVSQATAGLVGAARSDLRLLAVTLSVLTASGGPAVPALQRLGHTLTGAQHGRRQAAAQSGQALASAALMATAPTVFAVLIGALSPAAGRFYLHDPLATGCVAVAIALSYLGWWWMQRQLSTLERRVT